MSIQIERFLKAAKEYETVKDQLTKVSEELQAVLTDTPVGTYIQDAETGLVYKTVVPNGTFIYFKKLDYVRTAKEGERAGTLSKKEAEGAGFKV